MVGFPNVLIDKHYYSISINFSCCWEDLLFPLEQARPFANCFYLQFIVAPIVLEYGLQAIFEAIIIVLICRSIRNCSWFLLLEEPSQIVEKSTLGRNG